MTKHIFIVTAVALTLVSCNHQQVSQSDNHKPHWSYTGSTGPSAWGNMDPEFKSCKEGKFQSPIDITTANVTSIKPITFNYQPSDFKMLDNGHTIQANFAPGNFADIRGETYELLQMHFHTTSEHTVKGKSYPLELHLVHKNKEGKLAVVGVFMELGKANSDLDTIWSNIPKEKNKEFATNAKLNPLAFIPNNRSYYNYVGSLTTPPCSEGVNWNVFHTPVKISTKQLDFFKKMYVVNSRPVQPVWGRIPASTN